MVTDQPLCGVGGRVSPTEKVEMLFALSVWIKHDCARQGIQFLYCVHSCFHQCRII